MKKYNITYKANDSLRDEYLKQYADEIKAIEDFYNELSITKPIIRLSEGPDRLIMSIYWKESMTNYQVATRVKIMPERKIDKSIVNSTRNYIRLSAPELKFFDSLDYQLTEIYATSSSIGQHITDWFGKGLDAGMNKPEKIKQFMEEHNYCLLRESAAGFLYSYAAFHLEDHDSFTGVDIRLGPMNVIAKQRMIKRGVDEYVRTYEYMEFSNEELKFFDNLDMEIQLSASTKTGQYIEDWFGKGLDKAEKKDLHKVIDFFEGKGYELKERTEYALNFVKMLPNNTNGRCTVIAIEGIDDFGVVTADKGWARYRDDSGLYWIQSEKFTDDELKLLDSLDIILDGEFREETGQHIEDWFDKGLDAYAGALPGPLATREQKVKDAMRIYEDTIIKAFSFYKNYLGKEPKISYFEKGSTFTMNVSWPKGDGKLRTKITFSPRREVVGFVMDKYGELNYRKLTASELKFFDRNNFDLDSDYGHNTSQHIEDWFGVKDE